MLFYPRSHLYICLSETRTEVEVIVLWELNTFSEFNDYISVDEWYETCKYNLPHTKQNHWKMKRTNMIDKYNGVSSENVLPTLPCLMLLLFAVGDLGKICKIFKHQSNFFPASIFSHASANPQLETFTNQTQIWHRHRTGAPTVVVVESLQRFFLGSPAPQYLQY